MPCGDDDDCGCPSRAERTEACLTCGLTEVMAKELANQLDINIGYRGNGVEARRMSNPDLSWGIWIAANEDDAITREAMLLVNFYLKGWYCGFNDAAATTGQ